MAKTYQDLLQNTIGRAWRLHLTGAQEGLILTITFKDCLVHWPGTCPQNNNARQVEEDITLPYQEGSALYDANTPTEVVSNYSKASLLPGREALMIRRPLPMLRTAPDVRSSDESESNISPNAPEYDGESKGQRRARERRNKLKEGHRRRARQRKEAQDAYKIQLAEYHKRKSDKEAEERCAARVHGPLTIKYGKH
jgi:hypothetical protein